MDEWFDSHLREPIAHRMEEFEEKDSGWSLHSILHLAVHINKLNPLLGNCNISLSEDIQKKHACVNIKNTDKKCFLWAVLAGLYPVKRNRHLVSEYRENENVLNFKRIDFPMNPRDIPKFERQNDVSVNVYILKRYEEHHKVSPLYLTSNKKVKHVNLLLVQDYYIDENAAEVDYDNINAVFHTSEYHYVLITSLSILVCGQLPTHGHMCFICDWCLHFFHTEGKLQKHEIDCVQ